MPIEHARERRLAQLVGPAQNTSIGDLTFGIERELQQHIAGNARTARIVYRCAMRQGCAGIDGNARIVRKHLCGALQREEPDRRARADDGYGCGNRNMGSQTDADIEVSFNSACTRTASWRFFRNNGAGATSACNRCAATDTSASR